MCNNFKSDFFLKYKQNRAIFTKKVEVSFVFLCLFVVRFFCGNFCGFCCGFCLVWVLFGVGVFVVGFLGGNNFTIIGIFCRFF